MGFDGIKDQETAVHLLRNVLRTGRIPNAMLFWGPGGVGKRLTAIEMAKALNCREREHDACDDCLSCRRVSSGNHPDVRVIVPARRSRLIDLEAITEVTELASLRPYESPWRVFVLQDADRLTPPAQNRFLKTLEEPPGNSLFLLTTEYPRLLLPTIRSRCQPVRFRALRPDTVTGLLMEQRDLPPETAAAIAGLAQGQMSRALDLVDAEKREVALAVTQRLEEDYDPVALAEEFTQSLAEQRKLVEASVQSETGRDESRDLSPEEREELKAEQMALVDALCRRDMLEYLYLLEAWYRDQLVYEATGQAEHVLNKDQLGRLEAEPARDPGAKIVAIENARKYLDRYVAEERVFRDLFFRLAAR